MKKIRLMAGAFLLLAGGCTREGALPQTQPDGAAITFNASTTYGNRLPESRTAYSGEIFSDGYRTVERIDWVEGDRITIACAETPEGKADYQIAGGGNGTSAMMLKPVDPDGGLSWGTGEHRFMALYPAASTEGVGEGTVSVEGNAFCARIPDTQHVTDDGESFATDMRLAYMWAAAKASRDGTTPVKLSFRPMMTAFEFTLSAMDPYPLVLNSLALESGKTPLAGTFTATVSEDLQSVSYLVDQPANRIEVNLGGAVVDQEKSITFTVFCLPTDITALRLILDTGEGVRTLDFVKDGQWITFAGGLKLRIRNLPVETQDLLFEGTANGSFTVSTIDRENQTVYTETTVSPADDGHFSVRLPRLSDQPSHYRIAGENKLLTITHFPETLSTDASLDSFLRGSRTLTAYVPFETRGITRLNSLFRDCAALREVQELDTSSGENFAYMFAGCTSLKEGPALDTSSGLSVAGLFSGCTALASVPKYDTAKSTSFASMFNDCRSLKEAPAIDTGKGESFANMFYGCALLKTVPWYNTAQGTSFRYMFSRCTSLTTVPLMDTGKGYYFDRMFEGDTALEEIPLLPTGGGATFAYMFNSCTSLRTVPLLNLSKGRFLNSMFYNCRSLTRIPAFNTSGCEEFDNMFRGCTALEEIPALSGIKGKSFYGMFMECTALRSCGLSDTGSGTRFGYMFYDCQALEEAPALDLSKGTDFKCMFYGCETLETVPAFNTESGTDFSYMFSNCFSLKSFPGMNTTSGTSFQNMFKGDSFLASMGKIDCAGAATDSDMEDFVTLCTSLTETQGFGAVKVNLDIRDLPAREATVMTIVEGLATAYGKELTLSPAQIDKLTEADKQAIAEKGWTVVSGEPSVIP